MKNISIAILALFLSISASAQQTPAPEQDRSILIVGGTAHLGTGDVIIDAAIGFRDGKIDYVGKALRLTPLFEYRGRAKHMGKKWQRT